jgi:hypothetical protein
MLTIKIIEMQKIKIKEKNNNMNIILNKFPIKFNRMKKSP